MRPGCAWSIRPKRAWGTPDARCTRGLVCNWCDRTHTSNNEYPGITRRSRTQWFYGLCRALPGDRALLPPSPRGYVLSKPGWADLTPQDLTPASGCQDHTISPSAATSLVRPPGDRSRIQRTRPATHRAQDAAASTASHPYVRDDRDTPLCVGRDGATHRDVSTLASSKISEIPKFRMPARDGFGGETRVS
jgi:hypothetical protein